MKKGAPIQIGAPFLFALGLNVQHVRSRDDSSDAIELTEEDRGGFFEMTANLIVMAIRFNDRESRLHYT